MKAQRHLLLDLAGWFEEASVEYAVVGGAAVIRHGFVRNTRDVDVLVAPKSLEAAVGRLEREGFTLRATDEANFRIYRRGATQRIDVLLANNAFLQRILERRSEAIVAGRATFASAEDVVAMKLKAVAADPSGRGKDLIDVRELLARSEGEKRRALEGIIHLFRREDLL